jgi:hypothetical protein
MTTILVNPMDETPRMRGRQARRLTSLAESRIGLLDISKPGGSVFLDETEKLLRSRWDVRHVIRRTKPTFTKPAPLDLIQEMIAACDGVIEALAD